MSEDIRRLGERYELGEVIGRGGMAEVFEGRDLRLQRRVAVKILHKDLVAVPEKLEAPLHAGGASDGRRQIVSGEGARAARRGNFAVAVDRRTEPQRIGGRRRTRCQPCRRECCW